VPSRRAPWCTIALAVLMNGGCRSRAQSEQEYRALFASGPAAQLLAAEDEPWRSAQRIVWGPEPYATAFRALWSDAGLFVRFDVTDADPWHTLTGHDERLWQEDVVEIFVQPEGLDGEYGELEINAGNVTCDVWVRPDGRRFDRSWNLDGLESRVAIRRNPAGSVEGWTALAILPWRGFVSSAPRATLPPRPRDRWRFNVFRIERPGGRAEPERGALFLAWSPTGQPTFHVPSAFRTFVFLPSR
jgi:hypothetical protein